MMARCHHAPFLAVVVAAAGSHAAVVGVGCVVRPDTRIVYSKADGVGGASLRWVEDFLWWLHKANPGQRYQGLTAGEIQACDLGSLQAGDRSGGCVGLVLREQAVLVRSLRGPPTNP